MATHTGSEGTVRVGANTIAEIRSYSVEETSDTAEDTSMGDSYRTFKTTLKAWSFGKTVGALARFWRRLAVLRLTWRAPREALHEAHEPTRLSRL